MTEKGRRSEQPDEDNETALAKVLSAGGAALRLLGDGVDHLLQRVADIVADAEKAFRQGLDPNIEDAKILEEKKRRRKGTKSADHEEPVER